MSAGPRKTPPFMSNLLPWQLQSRPVLLTQLDMSQPVWVHVVVIAYTPFASRPRIAGVPAMTLSVPTESAERLPADTSPNAAGPKALLQASIAGGAASNSCNVRRRETDSLMVRVRYIIVAAMKTKERAWALRPAFDLATIALVLAWTALTVTEIAAGPSTVAAEWLNRLATLLGIVFVVELALRFRSTPSPARFARDYWMDVLAVSSIFLTAFFPLPLLRLLRLLRVYRVVVLAQKTPFLAGFVRHRGPRRALALLGIVSLCAVVATAALLAFEGGKNPELATFDQAFWFSLYSIFATQPTPNAPASLGGRIVSLFLIFVGLSMFAVLTGTVSAVLTNRIGKEGMLVEWEDLKDHIIICGWNRKAEIIVREWDATHKDQSLPIVVIAKLEGTPSFTDPALRRRVQFLDEDCTKVSALERAGIMRAATCILLSDTTKGRSERDADARTILAALTVERMNPKVYTCAELNRREYSTHLTLGCVDDFVVSGEHSAFLLAQAALNHGTATVWSELLSYEYGHKFCRVPVPKKLIGKDFLDALSYLKKHDNLLAIAVASKGKPPKINPQGHVLAESDELVVIADASYPS